MKVLYPVLLQMLAFAVAMAEVVVPSFGILSLLCAGLLIWSWTLILALPAPATLWFGIADLVLIPVGFWLGFKLLGRSPASHRTDLGTGSGLEDLASQLTRHVGSTVPVEASLRPTGKIRIGDEVFEAQTAGDWVERGALVKVVSVAGSRFQVEKV